MDRLANNHSTSLSSASSSQLVHLLGEVTDLSALVVPRLSTLEISRLSRTCKALQQFFDASVCERFDAKVRDLVEDEANPSTILSLIKRRGDRLGESPAWMKFVLPKSNGGSSHLGRVVAAEAFSVTVLCDSVILGSREEQDILDFLQFASKLDLELLQKYSANNWQSVVDLPRQTLRALRKLCESPMAWRKFAPLVAPTNMELSRDPERETPGFCVAEEYLKLGANFRRYSYTWSDRDLGLQCLTELASMIPADLNSNSRARLLAICFDHACGLPNRGAPPAKALFDAVLRMAPDTCGIDLWAPPAAAITMLSYLPADVKIPAQDWRRLTDAWSEDNWVIKAMAQQDPARKKNRQQVSEFGKHLVAHGCLSKKDWQSLYKAWKKFGDHLKHQLQAFAPATTTATTTTTTTTLNATVLPGTVGVGRPAASIARNDEPQESNTETQAFGNEKKAEDPGYTPVRKAKKSPLKRLSMRFSDLGTENLKQPFSPRPGDPRTTQGKVKEREKEKEKAESTARDAETKTPSPRNAEKQDSQDSSSED